MHNIYFIFIYRKKEQNENPGAAIQAIKYYNYSIKKKPNETFKPLVTEEAIKEESEEIEKILGIVPHTTFVIYLCIVLVFSCFCINHLHTRVRTHRISL
jgi:hypothetical protein